MNTAVAGVSKLNPDELVAKSLYVEGMLTVNVGVFATPNPKVTDLSAARTVLTTAIKNATGGDHEMVRLKRESAKDMRGLITKEAVYVNSIALGDADIIGLSGFSLRKSPSPIGPLVAPDGLSLEWNGKEGQLTARWKRRYGTKMYKVYITTGNPNDPAAVWTFAGQSSRTRFTLEGLTPGHFYAAVVTAVGTAGESGKSEPAISVAA